MKTLKNPILLPIIFLFVGACNISFAQFQNVNANTANSRLDNIKTTMAINYEKSENTNGSPFVNNTFQVIKLKRFGNTIFAGRYNANLGEMQIKREKDTIALNNSEDFRVTFALNNKVYQTFDYTNENGSTKRGFLVVLDENDSFALLKEEVIKFYEEIPAKNSYGKTKPAEFRRLDDNYYYKIGDKVSFLPQKRRSFLKLFPDNNKKIKTFIKEQRLRLKNEKDLIKIFEFINSLNIEN